MDIYLLQLIGHWLSVFFVTLVSLFNFNIVKTTETNVENNSYTKATTVLNQIVNYKTVYVYNSNKSISSKPTILQQGSVGLIYSYENGQKKVVKQPVNQIVELGTAKATTYIGRLTTYTPYCVGCSPQGNVACKVKGKKFSLIKNGQYYVDSTYGRVRILAAALQAFPCGTIVHVDTGTIPPFVGIVLDTGGSMRYAYKNGYVWMDLAYQHKGTAEAKKAGTKHTKFTVLRWGW